jgi:predicted fused transcriptional regulator/phosphomethylpyrimidine kinase/predicted transcriptional regulator
MVVKLLPALRALISHYLIQEYGFTQEQAAHVLGVTQASISRSLSQLNRFEQYYTPNIQQTAQNFAKRLSQGQLNLEESIAALCTFCAQQKIGGTVCQLHRSENPELKECMVCGREFISDDRVAVLNNLARSGELLSNTKEFIPLIPQVRSQLVMSIPKPQGLDDVAGFPSRIVPHHKRPHFFTGPEFGGSYHLSRVLLLVQRFNPEIHSAIVFKYHKGLETVLKKIGFTFTEVQRISVDGQKDTDEALLAGIEKELEKTGFVDVLIDKGLIGIEPVAYLFAPKAETATKKIIEIATHLQN